MPVFDEYVDCVVFPTNIARPNLSTACCFDLVHLWPPVSHLLFIWSKADSLVCPIVSMFLAAQVMPNAAAVS